MEMRFEPISAAIGALVHGFQAEDLGDPTFDSLYQALIDYQMLVIPNGALAPAELASLGRGLGSVSNSHHLYASHPECDDVVVLEWGGDDKPDASEWHADMTYKASPPFASVLQAVVVPPVGGDTLWASMYSVYDSLSSGLQSELNELHAVHDMGAFRTPAYVSGGPTGLADALADSGSAVHPVVNHHPVTGRPYLNVSESFTRFAIGMSAPEGARLLTMLFDAINRPEHHARLRWSEGMIAIWDNRGTQHYAIADYRPNRRVMHRVAIGQDWRVAPDATSDPASRLANS